MKRILLAAMASIALLISSCGKSDEDSSISFPFSVSGNTLTIEFVENAKKFVFKYKKITQAELDAILATANNNNGGN